MSNTLGLTAIKRTALIVSDLDAAVGFYSDVFDMTVILSGPVDDPTVFTQLGLIPGQARFSIMKAEANAPDFGMLSVMEVRDPAPETVPQASCAARRGEAVVVMHVQDLDTVFDRLLTCQAKVICPPITFTPPNGVPQREVTFRDPDGILACVIEDPKTL
jgi:catechol 2,3-dioxygenase-like lactoylglutathione lyase family enzyme